MNVERGAVDWEALCAEPQVKRLVELALEEDIGSGDVTTEAVFRQPQQGRARVAARRPTVACGVPLARDIVRRFDAAARLSRVAVEGSELGAGEALFELEGDVRALLTCERVMLNFLMRLCGVAAGARAAARQVPQGARARIFDTRKTVPGWRLLDKAAVRTGGARNHRMGLFDAVLIKDNHIAAAGSISGAIRQARAASPGLEVEVEIDRLDQLDEALAAGPDIILLDNFADAALAEAVRRVAGRAQLEASGGVTLERIPAIARTGVDRISLGALTHTVQPAELGLDFEM